MPGTHEWALPNPRAQRVRGPQWDAISVAGHTSRAVALQLPGNPLDPNWDARVLAPAISECKRLASAGDAAPYLIAWSGTFADSLFGGDMRNWMRPGWDALQQRLDIWCGTLEGAGVRLALHPHSTHLLSDVAGAMRLLVDRAGQPFDVICAPAALLTPDMLGDGAREGTRGRIAEARDVREHLLRALSVLGPRTPLLALADVRLADAPAGVPDRESDADDRVLEPCAPGTGMLPWDALIALVAEHVPPHVPTLAE
jgi:sugar phosphate isomerase/epimerase